MEQITEGGITYQIETNAVGDKVWYLNGKKHRVDGPAFEDADGTKVWFLNGKQHRVEGPAIEYADGTKWWYLNDKLHRVDGPAIEGANGTKSWWLNGDLLTKEEFNEFRKKLKELKQNPIDAPLFLHDKHLGFVAREILEESSASSWGHQ